MLDSASSDKSTRRGTTPHCKFRAMRVLSSLVKAKIGGFGRLRDRSDAMCPCFVYTKMASTPRLLAAPIGKFYDYTPATMQRIHNGITHICLFI
uniref:Uncharacterized protein n=1 Tax=Cajanus cajan TaxID=3821 RepID=A0A151U7E9_CAJCA|nr:hypothetical protein KK1_007951 [Cajanus cajan]